MFSVVVPTYNRPQSLASLLESLRIQKYPHQNFEVIVVYTQGDISESFLKSFRSPFTLTALCIDDPQFCGRSASLKRNAGAAKAKYPWLAFIDDDCIAHPEWLNNASLRINDSIHGIEGLTQIPKPDKPTFTYKGLLALSRFGGYQTCNMFYRKDSFFKVNGFDLNFPFYLEDTDLAWSFMDNNYKLQQADDVIVQHPVPPANNYRWIENAIRSRKIPYLAKKHPALFKKYKFKGLSKSSTFFILLLAFIIIGIAANGGALLAIALGAGLYLGSTSLYVFYLLRKCHYSAKELFEMLCYYPIIPPLSFVQLMRGNIDHHVFVL